MNLIRSFVKKHGRILRPVLKAVLSVFFEKKYLVGRHFDEGYGGYLFAMRSAWQKNILRLSRPAPWPTGLSCTLSNEKNISFHVDDLNNFQSPGTYFQNFSAHIYIGKGVYIAPNVGVITANHDFDDLDSHGGGQDVAIGDGSWIGMNSVILPGVVLGEKTMVAAGSVVNKSFPDGKVLIGGSPARVLKVLG